MLRSIKYILLFFGLEFLAILIFMPLILLDGLEKEMLVIPAILLGNAAFIIYVCAKKKTAICTGFLDSKPWKLLFLCTMAALFFIMPECEFIASLGLPSDADDLDIRGMPIIGFLSIGIIAPIAEELLFRGVIQRSVIRTRWAESRPWLAIIISAGLFSLVHFDLSQMWGTFVMGLFAGWLCHKTGSLLPGIIIHITNNLICCILALVPSLNITDSFYELFESAAAYWTVLTLSIVMCCICVISIISLVNKGNESPDPDWGKFKEWE